MGFLLSCASGGRSHNLFAPPESRRCGLRLKRARGQPRLGPGGVVAGWGHVVRCVRMEERGQVLNVPAAGPELPLPATVGADAVLVAMVVAREELVQRAEAGGLDVHHLRRPGTVLDVGDR